MPVVLPWIIVGLAPLIAWLITFGVQQSFSAIGRAFLWLRHPRLSWASVWGALAILPAAIGLTRGQSAVHQAKDVLGKEAQGSEPVTAGFVAGLAGMVEYHAFTMKYLAAGTLDALTGVKAHTIPRAVDSRTRTAREQSEAASKRARAAGAAAAEAGAVAGRLGRSATRTANDAKATADKALAKAGAIGVPAPWDTPWARGKEQADAVSRWFARWKKAIIAGIGAAALTGVIVNVLTRQLPWFRCTNVNRTMRQLCRTPYHFLTDLLALAADFFVLANICTVIPWLEAAFETVAKPLVSTLTAVHFGSCNDPSLAAPKLAVPPLSLPQSIDGMPHLV